MLVENLVARRTDFSPYLINLKFHFTLNQYNRTFVELHEIPVEVPESSVTFPGTIGKCHRSLMKA